MSEFIKDTAERAPALEPMAAKVANSAARLRQLEDCTPDEARAMRAERGNPFAPAPADLHAVEDTEIPTQSGTIPARIYRPSPADTPQPALLYFHGGGFVLGDIAQYDTLCQQLAHHSGCVVVSVEYTLAPQAKIHQIHRQGLDSWCWLREQAQALGLDPSRMAIGGDSAGGNLTIGVLLLAGREGIPMPALQLLIYPSVDLKMSFPSVAEFAEDYFLTRAGMSWFRSHYLETPEQASEPALQFLQQDLTGMPPAHVITAGFDPLRDEGQAFVERLQEFDIPVTHHCYTDMIHAFVSFAGGVEPGMAAIEEMAEVLRDRLA